MKRITYVTVFLFLVTQFNFSQNIHKRITIQNPDTNILHELGSSGIDLTCGLDHKHDEITLDLSETEIEALIQKDINFTIEIEDLTKFYSERAARDLPKARAELAKEKAITLSYRQNKINQKSTITHTIKDNIIQYTGCDEIDWTVPLNFNLGSLGGGMTVIEMEAELDDMYNYSQTNGLDIISQKLDASPSGQTTWGNPSNTITNNGLTYSGMGTTRWNPKTIYYVRITGNQSSTPENTKPQMLFTSMIHAREAAALMNNMFFMWYLIENYNIDPAVTELINNNELYFVPIVNPDGVLWNEHLSSSGGTMQRKNCRPNTGSTSNSTEVRGVDLNRNFDYYWGYNNIGSSGTPSNQTYRGPSPASEPETQIMVDFITSHNFRTAVWNHSYANSVPHPYGGIPTLESGREDEFHKWHEEMTRYNRYLYGATIFYESNGIPDDWMLGGAPDNNGSTGSGVDLLATTPEHGSSSDGFWPSTTSYIPIAKRSMRIAFGTAYYGGQYAKLHDLTQSNITNTTANLDFGIERIGQSDSDFTLTVTPISSNIISITSPSTETGMSVLEQRTVTATLQLDSGIITNAPIEYNVKLYNDNGVIYEADFVKYYQPTLLFNHNPDTQGLTGWTQSGWSNTTSDAYSGNNALKTGDAVPYATNSTKTLTTSTSFDLSGATEILIQYYSKWDLERNYDFVELQGSTDGSTWQSLCGKYTKPNATSTTTSHDNKGGASTFQQSNSTGHLYDGDRMDNWVMEEFVIDSSNNTFMENATNAQFRFRFRSDSSDASENYSTTSDGFYVDDFKIIYLQIPCQTDVPTNMSASSITGTEALISWNSIPSATYDLRYRINGTSTWNDVLDITSNSYTLTGLSPSTMYDVEVRSKCDTNTSSYSSTINFTTTMISYCSSNGQSTQDEYISYVMLNTINNSSSDGYTSTGYSDFTSISTDLDKNLTHTISVTKYWTGSVYAEAVAVWIDFNMDGDFNDPDENVLSSNASTTNPVSGTITIPSGALLGTTRMRVSLKYNALSTPCESFQYGEVEDYTVNITDATLSNNIIKDTDVYIYPNPFNNHVKIQLSEMLQGHNLNIRLMDLSGRLIKEISTIHQSYHVVKDIKSLDSGSYLLTISDLDSGFSITKKIIKN